MQHAVNTIAARDPIDVQTVPPGPQRLNGLDGLRAIAVAAVLSYHSELPWARGGYLGVDLFFVISGFLITFLLVSEIEATSGLRLADFYWRRAKRLLPASWLMTASAIAAAWLLAPDALSHLKGDTFASLFYVTNWELLSAKASYFETIGRQPLLLHLWSLAIEEQFYIIWAPLMLLGLGRFGRSRLAVFAAVLAALLIGWTAWLANQNGYLVQVTPTRLDFGTDTHSFPLLIGAVLGLLWRPDRQSQAAETPVSDGVFTLGLAALGATLFLFARLGEETPRLYPWGFLLCALASTALVAAATFRGSFFGRWLDQQPLRWIGQRSYGIYLWHWPIFMLMRPEDVRLDAYTTFALRVALTVSVAAVSYRFVETPIRNGLLEWIWTGVRTPGRRFVSLGSGVLVALATVTVFVPIVALLRASPSEALPASDVRQVLRAIAQRGHGGRPPVKRVAVVATPAPLKTFGGSDVTLIGDSVLLGSTGTFRSKLPGAKLYARVGWQARDVLIELQTLARTGALAPVVLIHLGTNGYVYEEQLRSILALLTDRQRVIIVNAHAPRRWVAPNNELMDRVLPEYRNAVLVDWRSVSETQPGYFVADKFHLTPAGQRALVGEILRAGHLSSAGEDAAAPGAPTGLAVAAISSH